MLEGKLWDQIMGSQDEGQVDSGADDWGDTPSNAWKSACYF